MYFELLCTITYLSKTSKKKDGALPGGERDLFKMEALHTSLGFPEVMVIIGLALNLQRT